MRFPYKRLLGRVIKRIKLSMKIIRLVKSISRLVKFSRLVRFSRLVKSKVDMKVRIVRVELVNIMEGLHRKTKWVDFEFKVMIFG